MTFREFIQLWEQDWHLDPEHVWFDDPEMTRFLSPKQLKDMYAVKRRVTGLATPERQWRNRRKSQQEDPGLTTPYPEPPPTEIRGGSATRQPGDCARLAQDLEDVKRRLAKLEKPLA